ncbi:MAG TPA: DUF1592 domain-containing protein, partial [Polyangiaceae bacterium]
MIARSNGRWSWIAVAVASHALLAGCTSDAEGDAPGGEDGSAGVFTGGNGAGPGGNGQTAGGLPGAVSGRGGATGASGATGQGGPAAFESVARRLSRTELNNVLADVLGDSTNPANQFLLEDEYAPYDNDYTLQSASQALIDGLNAFAEDVARRALADPARRAALVPCSPTGPGDASCFRQVIESVGAKLLRRPLADAEVERYLTLQAFATEDNPHVDNDFYTAVELFFRAVLQDPEFLYRIEVGEPTANPGISVLNSHEVASRLSFLIAGSTPDATLLAEARSNALLDAPSRRAQAERLLGTERARDQLHRYHAMWLGY